MPTIAIKPLSTAADYVHALGISSKIDNAVRLTESGRRLANLDCYIKACNELMERVIQANDIGYNPNMHIAHSQLTRQLQGLAARITIAASKMGVTPPRKDLVQMLKINNPPPAVERRQVSAWTWPRIAKYSTIGTMLVLTAPQLWSLTKSSAPLAARLVVNGASIIASAPGTVQKYTSIVEGAVSPITTFFGQAPERSQLALAFLSFHAQNIATYATSAVKSSVPLAGPMASGYFLGQFMETKFPEILPQPTRILPIAVGAGQLMGRIVQQALSLLAPRKPSETSQVAEMLKDIRTGIQATVVVAPMMAALEPLAAARGRGAGGATANVATALLNSLRPLQTAAAAPTGVAPTGGATGTKLQVFGALAAAAATGIGAATLGTGVVPAAALSAGTAVTVGRAVIAAQVGSRAESLFRPMSRYITGPRIAQLATTLTVATAATIIEKIEATSKPELVNNAAIVSGVAATAFVYLTLPFTGPALAAGAIVGGAVFAVGKVVTA